MLKQLSDELLAAYGDLRHFLMRKLGDRELAADLAQTSFERAYACRADALIAGGCVALAGPGRWPHALNASNLFHKEYVATCLDRGDCWFGLRRKVVASMTYRW